MCIPANQKALKGVDRGEVKPTNATDVPLGDGLADAAKVSILSRRKRIEDALAAAGG